MYYYSPFRRSYAENRAERAAACDFCDTEIMGAQAVRTSEEVLIENEHYRWIINFFPKFEGHTMVVPKRHLVNLGEETPEEVIAREALIVIAANALRELYPAAGIEVFIQTGSGSESSISHLHWHVVPALPDDHLRGFDKLGHYCTVEPGQETHPTASIRTLTFCASGAFFVPALVLRLVFDTSSI